MSTGTDQVLSFSWPKYPQDKVIYQPAPRQATVTQSVSPAVPTYVSVTFDNPVQRYFIMDLQVSVDGGTWYDSGLEPSYYDAGTLSQYKRFLSLWSMTTTLISLKFAALDASYTMHYRLVGVSLE